VSKERGLSPAVYVASAVLASLSMSSASVMLVVGLPRGLQRAMNFGEQVCKSKVKCGKSWRVRARASRIKTVEIIKDQVDVAETHSWIL
jgi:hypothetical protein